MRQLTALFFIVLMVAPTVFSAKTVASENLQLVKFLSQQSGYVIDEVLTLLENLRDGLKSDLDSENDSWSRTKPILDESVRVATDEYNLQVQKCNDLSNQIDAVNAEIKKRQDEITANTNRINTNNQNVKDWEDKRCLANKIYINSLRDNLDALRLIEALRDAINGFNPATSSFAAIKNQFRLLANLYARDFVTVVNNLQVGQYQLPSDTSSWTHERTAEEIGTGHVDNKQEQLVISHDIAKVMGFGEAKIQLLNLLDKIKASIEETNGKLQAAEVKANEDLANYKVDVIRENKYLEGENKRLTKEIEDLVAKKLRLEADWEVCKTLLEQLRQKKELAEKSLKDATDSHNAKVDRLTNEINLFNEVIAIYKAQVSSAANQYKDRTQDYYSDNKFDNADYTKRDASSYDPYSGQVRQKVMEEAKQPI